MTRSTIELPENETLVIEIASITDLPTANPNRMSDSRFQRLKANIAKYGFLQPILVYRSGKKKYVLSDGFHRRKAMMELGQTTIEAKVFKSKASAETAGRLLRIAMNQVRGEGNIDGLSEEISSLLESGVGKLDLEDTGINADEIDAILSCADLDVTALLTSVAAPIPVAPEKAPRDEPLTHKLTFIFATQEDKQLVVDRLANYAGGPAEALIAALSK